MDNLCCDVIGYIFQYLDTIDLILSSRTCKKWRKAFNTNLWRYTMDLSLTPRNRITDTGLAHLKGVQTINLSFCWKITDAGLAHLKGVQKINLSRCRNITDAGLSYLKGKFCRIVS